MDNNVMDSSRNDSLNEVSITSVDDKVKPFELDHDSVKRNTIEVGIYDNFIINRHNGGLET
jgi:hypothetical protein